METSSNIIAKGGVNIQVFEGEKLIDTIQEDNLVVTLGKTNITKLLGGDAAGKSITQISVGTNGTAPDVTDAGLQNSFTKAVSAVSYPDNQSVQFSFDLTNDDANGITIAEFGLMASDGTLFARKVRGSGSEIVKTNAIRLVGTWKIKIV